MQSILSQVRNFSKPSRAEVLFFILVFASIFITAQLEQLISFVWDIYPTVIWAPLGIAVAIIFLYGYRTIVPIAIAFFVAAFFDPASAPLLLVLIIAGTHTLTPVCGAYLLKRFKCTGQFNTLKETIRFILITIFIATLTPSFALLAHMLTHSFMVDPLIEWSRSWVGRVISILVITPVILIWILRRDKIPISTTRERITIIVALCATIVSCYVLFWIPLAESFSFLFEIVLLATLFWIALHLNTRIMVLTLFIIAIIGLTGVFLAPQVFATPIHERLFLTELFIILIAPLFLTFASLMQEHKTASQSLESHVTKLEDAMMKLTSEDEAKNEFLAILAHELRNPLAAILSSIELISAQGHQAKETPELLDAINQRVRAMSTLLDDLLDVSRISRHKFTLTKELVSLTPILANSIKTTDTFMRTRGHTLAVIAGEEEIILEADPTRLEQIIVNLLNNAIKYTEPGGNIELSAYREGREVFIRVRDSGIGLPPHMLGRIFEPFFQIKTAGKQSAGLGVGLSLTRQLVHMHGGTIVAHSKGQGTGSEFIVRLPVPTAAEISAFKIKKNVPQALRISHTTKNSLKILVVDDNEIAADSLSQLLRLRGYDVEVAHNGAEGFEKAIMFHPHVAILDIGMPDLDGYEIVGLLRQEKLSCTYVALTGYGQTHDKEKALLAGFDYHLTKPAGLKEIETILRKVARAIKKA